MSEMPEPIDPAASSNVALILIQETLAVLLHNNRITEAELDQIFQKVKAKYTSPIMPPAVESWQKQIQPLVETTYNAVLLSAQAD